MDKYSYSEMVGVLAVGFVLGVIFSAVYNYFNN